MTPEEIVASILTGHSERMRKIASDTATRCGELTNAIVDSVKTEVAMKRAALTALKGSLTPDEAKP